MSLGLVPTIKIKTSSVEITPKDTAFKNKIIKGSALSVSIPLYGIFVAPSATVELVEPEVHVVRKNGKFNFESLMSPKQQEETMAEESKDGATSSFVQSKIRGRYSYFENDKR
ncbi:MAG: hypothetical protein R3A80_06065 [Bdellovibrionota bacterium]